MLANLQESGMDSPQPEWLEQVEGVLETLNQGVLIADDCRKIVYVNQIMQDMVGIESGKMIGKNSVEFFPVEDTPFLSEQIQRGMVNKANQFEFYLPHSDGKKLPVVVSSRVIEDPDGREFAVVSFTDITEQKLAEDGLRQANQKLEAQYMEIEDDLKLAARVQQSLAPKNLRWGDVEVETHYQPVRSIGGDFGLVGPGEDFLNLIVCDVSGHGISSALVANRIYTEMKGQIDQNVPIPEMLRHLNRFVLGSLSGSVFFFTMAMARLTRQGGRLEFAGAGHPPGMLLRKGRPAQWLQSKSIVLGLLEAAVDGDPTTSIDLEVGDRVVLYTDGLTDVFDANREMLGVDGLTKIVQEASELPIKEMKERILQGVADWREGPEPDDISLIIAEVHFDPMSEAAAVGDLQLLTMA
jgi:PAS domain S-box-containing protein